MITIDGGGWHTGYLNTGYQKSINLHGNGELYSVNLSVILQAAAGCFIA
jgi:hypothetical protein